MTPKLATLATCLTAFLMVTAAAYGQGTHGERSKTAKETPAETLKHKLDRGEKILIVDVREPNEMTGGSIPGAVNIPMSELAQRMKDIPKKTQVVFTCNSGRRSSQAAELFQKNGYEASSYCPLSAWKERRLSLQPAKKAESGTLGSPAK